jgi:hypothetical protein
MAAELVEHWFNRRWRVGRRDVYLTRDDNGWHVKARRGGWDGIEVVHDFTSEADAHAMLLRALETAPPGEDDWARMPKRPPDWKPTTAAPPTANPDGAS